MGGPAEDGGESWEGAVGLSGRAEAATKRQGGSGLLKGTQVGVQSPYPRGRRKKGTEKMTPESQSPRLAQRPGCSTSYLVVKAVWP